MRERERERGTDRCRRNRPYTRSLAHSLACSLALYRGHDESVFGYSSFQRDRQSERTRGRGELLLARGRSLARALGHDYYDDGGFASRSRSSCDSNAENHFALLVGRRRTFLSLHRSPSARLPCFAAGSSARMLSF